eukprot:644400-Pelagomonas_calceolata.AAC.2
MAAGNNHDVVRSQHPREVRRQGPAPHQALHFATLLPHPIPCCPACSAAACAQQLELLPAVAQCGGAHILSLQPIQPCEPCPESLPHTAQYGEVHLPAQTLGHLGRCIAC